jgi:hypothetical protein
MKRHIHAKGDRQSLAEPQHVEAAGQQQRKPRHPAGSASTPSIDQMSA